MSNCRHYKGICFMSDGVECSIGRDAKKIANYPVSGWGLRLPCISSPETACDVREEWSPAEIAMHERSRKIAAEQSRLCISALPWASSHAGESGKVPCPKCKTGEIEWHRSSRNGHIAASCSTPQCFGMIQ